MRYLRRWSSVVTTLVILGLVAACADNGSSDRTTTGKVEPAGRESQGEACGLLDDASLAKVFTHKVPDPSGTSMGTGFAECEWSASGGSPLVLVSMLPAADFRSDYVKQLTVSAPVEGLGDGAVSFPGLVGIGRGSADGGSVGFTTDDHAAIVAVQLTGDPTKDAAEAEALAKVVAKKL